MEKDEEKLFKFPCDFPVKIMGNRTDTFAQEILAIVLQHAPDFKGDTMEIRASAEKKYLSLTCTVRATSREQLDNLYRALHKHPDVKMML